MLVYRHIKLENNTNFFAESFSVIMLESILMLQFGLLKCFGLKKRYSILFRLIDNFFVTIQENIFLIRDLVNDNTVVSSGKKDKYIWVSSA